MDISGFKEKKKVPRESSIEAYLVSQIRKLGGLCKKWTAPGSSGEPDRIIIWDGLIEFVELKRPGGRLSELQKVKHKELKAQGAKVFTLSSRQEVDDYVFRLKALKGQAFVE